LATGVERRVQSCRVAADVVHDLRRGGARNFRRVGVAKDVSQRIGGWKTPSMFRRYNVVD
jgi:hypothetical protein